MIAVLLAMLLAADPPRPPQALPPADWSALPTLVMTRPVETTPDMSAYVRGEVARNHCTAVPRQGTGWRLTVDLAVLVTPEGQVHRIVPRAIHCPTVEQYAAGLIQSMARGNLEALGGDAEHWYRTTLTFAWAA